MDRTSVFIWIGLLFSIAGTLLSFSWNSIFDLIAKKELPISPTSKTYPLWKKSTVTMNFYLFNWTNHDQLFENNYTPEFVELGPYSYTEVYEKVNLTWNANHTVTYQRIRKWYFDAENSNGSLDDTVVMLNIVPVSSSFFTRNWSFISIYALSAAMRMLGESIWVRRTVREILFDGYDDPLLKIAQTAPSLFGTDVQGDKVAWFFNRNGSARSDGVLNAETASEDMKNLGIIRSWNYKDKSDFFDGECSKVAGSVGDIFPPVQMKEDQLEMFVPDFCRSLKLDYSEEVEVRGIPAYRYEASQALIDNGTVDSTNHCNCRGECLPLGVFNISACRYGIPAFISYPHFYKADKHYLRQLKGLEPVPKRHRFYITLEPRTGILLDLKARVQINFLLQRNTRINLFRNVPTILFPVLWFEELGSIPPSEAFLLRLLLLLPVVGQYISFGLTLIGLVIISAAILPMFLNKYSGSLHHCLKRKSSETIISQTSLPIGRFRPPPSEGKDGAIPPEEHGLLDTKIDN
ncbi:hypothetical protein B7P43_G08759 [Cryptotermes secundus]|uniref:Protein croquemort n=1 Tax=Cryptotermes secundus TaxID=105785 RepID=A0A2J7RNT5_9NEOP|nr:protein peste [Cryptotermes secundus]PNF42501.1 hypothetical protein B7P43_G08759 [Cryptotermes secundus]